MRQLYTAEGRKRRPLWHALPLHAARSDAGGRNAGAGGSGSRRCAGGCAGGNDESGGCCMPGHVGGALRTYGARGPRRAQVTFGARSGEGKGAIYVEESWMNAGS